MAKGSLQLWIFLGSKWGRFRVNGTPSKSEVSELSAAKGPKHVDGHHICTGSQSQFNEPQTLQDATKSGCWLTSSYFTWLSIHIQFNHIYTLQLLWTHLCFYLTCFPKSQTEIPMITDVWIWIGFGWILWWSVPCFCLHKDQPWWELWRNVSAKPESTSVSHVFSWS